MWEIEGDRERLRERERERERDLERLHSRYVGVGCFHSWHSWRRGVLEKIAGNPWENGRRGWVNSRWREETMVEGDDTTGYYMYSRTI